MNLNKLFTDVRQDPPAFLCELEKNPLLANAIRLGSTSVYIMSELAQGTIQKGFTEPGLVQTLLDFGADPKLVIVRGESMLHRAVSQGEYSFELMKQIMDSGIAVNLPCGCIQNTPLHAACEAGNVDGIIFLLLNGADPNVSLKNGQTPLHTLIMNNPVYHGLNVLADAAKILIEYGADQSATITYKNELYTPADLVRRWVSYNLRRPGQYNTQSLYDTFR
jgi:ankyrin repeat protein